MSNLPVDTEKKKIDKAKFINLAKKIKKILEKEADYVEKERKKNGNNYTTRADLLT